MELTVMPREVKPSDELRCRYRGEMLVAWNASDNRSDQPEVWMTVRKVNLNDGYYTLIVHAEDKAKSVVLGPFGGRTQLFVRRPDLISVVETGPLDGATGIASLYLIVTVT